MTHSFRYSGKLSSGKVRGAILGFVAGVILTIESWLMAGLIKLLLTWNTGIWPEGIPGYIPDFILSRWWIIIVIGACTIVGTIVGSLSRRRLEIL